MEHVFVLKTNDPQFKDALDVFLTTHCEEKSVHAAVYELNAIGAEKVLAITEERQE